MLDSSQIFLSYAREDEIMVRAIFQKLKQAGFSVWMDTQNIRPGQRWRYEIKRALGRAELVIVFLSFKSIEKRGFLQREIKDALELLKEKLEGDIYLIPVRLDNCEVPISLADIQWVNMFAADGWDQLKLAITTALRQAALAKQRLERPRRVAARPAGEGALQILSPESGASVDYQLLIEGTVVNKTASVWLVVHAMEGSRYCVQQQVSVRDGGTWNGQVRVGRQGMVDAGKHFEIAAVSRPDLELHEAMNLDCWPVGQESQVIEVIRLGAEQPYSPNETRTEASESRNITISGSVYESTIVAGDRATINVGKPLRRKKRKFS